MGITAEKKNIIVKFTKSDAEKLVEHLDQHRNQLRSLNATDPITISWMAFLTQICEDVQKALALDEPAEMPDITL